MTKEEKIRKLQLYAKSKFEQHNLNDWHLHMSKNVGRILGMCHYDIKRIRMSLPWIDSLPLKESKQTFLHELAHAITDQNEEPHGIKWIENCKLVGCNDTNSTCITSRGLKRKYYI